MLLQDAIAAMRGVARYLVLLHAAAARFRNAADTTAAADLDPARLAARRQGLRNRRRDNAKQHRAQRKPCEQSIKTSAETLVQ